MEPKKSIEEAGTACNSFARTVRSMNLTGESRLLANLSESGDSYYFIFDFTTLELRVIGGQTEKVLGCPPPEVNIPFLMGNIHPGDYPAVINFESKVFHFFASLQPEKMLRYKVRYDFRIRKQNGSFIRILHQLRVCQQDKNGTPLLGLGVHSDITYLKPHGKPALSYIDMDKEATGLHADIKNSTPVGKNGFTPREKEVLTLLIDGKLSKEISNILHISKQTVDTHRKNMLHKKELSNTGELIGKAIRSGWI